MIMNNTRDIMDYQDKKGHSKCSNYILTRTFLQTTDAQQREISARKKLCISWKWSKKYSSAQV